MNLKKNAIATEEDCFDLSDAVYDDRTLHKGAEIKGHNKRWVVIESIDADCQKSEKWITSYCSGAEK